MTWGTRAFTGKTWLLPWLALVLLAAWTDRPNPWWLLAAAAAVIGSVISPESRNRTGSAGLLLLLAAVLSGFLAHGRLNLLAQDFEGYWERREADVAQVLEGELQALLGAGETAAEALTAAPNIPEGDPRYRWVARLRRSRDFTAMAVYDSTGRLLVWDGTHRGAVPDPVRLGSVPYAYADRPLFSHLYFTEPLPGGRGTAMVAALLRSDLPAALEAEGGDLASRIRARTGEEIRLSRAELAAGEGIWDLRLGEEILFSVAVARPSAAGRAEQVKERWAWALSVLVLVCWVVLAMAARGVTGHAGVAAVALASLGVLLPLGSVLRSPGLFAPGAFVLSGPLDLSLGQVLGLALAAALGLGLASAPSRALRGWAVAILVALLFPVLTALMQFGASPDFLAGTETGWVGFEVVLALLLALAAGAALRLATHGDPPAHGGWILSGALGLTVLLSGGAAEVAAVTGRLPFWGAALWSVPAGLAAIALTRWQGWRRELIGWTVAVVLGTSAALPFAWSGRIVSRMDVAERQLERLGGQVDPYLQFLLGRFGEMADSLDDRSGPAEVLYRAWVESGLANEGYPVWLTYWSGGGLPEEELRVGVGAVRPAVADDFLNEARTTGAMTVRRLDLADAHYLAVAPLRGGAVVTVVVPPLREIRFSSPLGPLFNPEASAEPDPLTLVPLQPGDPVEPTAGVRWVRVEDGWHGEAALAYPDAPFHAHYQVDLSPPLLLVARSTLLLALNLFLFTLPWALGVVLRQGGRPPRAEWIGLFASFRARVTLALFGFFLLSIAIFGTLAYRTITGAAERTAQVLAERVVQDAAGSYLEVQGEMNLLAERVGEDLLRFEDGALQSASVDELVQIGLYEGWIPYPTYRLLSTREEVLASRTGALGGSEYAIAYRNLPDGDILGAPVPLQEGAMAVRRRDVAHLIAFAVLVGAGLSLALALLVGRALTRPIQLLGAASERVGRGNLRVRLAAERADEFGSVFEAFNRMVLRLRRARRDLVRTTRRTQAIVEEAAGGVIAFGPDAEVTLVNAPAEALLGRSILVGSTLEDTGVAADEVVAWIRMYFRDALRVAGTEFQIGARRIRVRVRRISGKAAAGGAVMSLEDVTDELRAERVLAWGEMARQVAHEVKNPLTPIKLSIQHISRAWEDRRPDFGDILSRNAGAMLGEIDRLASIATSFSRLGAPGAADAGALEEVVLSQVVEEVLNLYSGGEGAIRFEREVEADLPSASAREPEVKEVLVNLLENARVAIREGGTVRVEAARDGVGLVLRVRDDGRGIPPELIPRVFEPHFSTRSTGTGLGLTIVRRLVESWGGTVAIDSDPEQGTTVTLGLRCWPHRGGGAIEEPSS